MNPGMSWGTGWGLFCFPLSYTFPGDSRSCDCERLTWVLHPPRRAILGHLCLSATSLVFAAIVALGVESTGRECDVSLINRRDQDAG